MSQWIEKQFKNNATTPINISVCALADGLPFAPEKPTDRITQIIATGGTITFADEARAESHRMRRWVERHFIGKTAAEFRAHNGIVPSAEDEDEAHAAKKRIDIVNTINVEFFNPPKYMRDLMDRIARDNLKRAASPPKADNRFFDAPSLGSKWRATPFDITYTVDNVRETADGTIRVSMKRDGEPGGRELYNFTFTSKSDWLRRFDFVPVDTKTVEKNSRQSGKTENSIIRAVATSLGLDFDQIMKDIDAENAGGKAAAAAPKPGTYWQDRNRPKRHFRVLEVRACYGHAHVRMQRTDGGNDGVFEWPFIDGEQWDKLFKQVDAIRMPLSDLERRWVVVPTEDAERAVEEYRTRFPRISEYFRDFIGGVPFEGTEQPPAPGERYYSYISDKTYTVIDVRRKLYSEDYYVLMERDGDKHRTKFTYHNHAEWLTVWRPLDDDDQPRKVEEVDVEQQSSRAHRPGEKTVEVVIDASDAIRQVGEAAHMAAEAAMTFRETDAERQLRVIYAELDKRVPNWQDTEHNILTGAIDGRYAGVVLDDTALAIRAIRALARVGKEYGQVIRDLQQRLDNSVEHANEQLRVIERKNKELAKQKHPLPAIGSVWKTNSTGNYSTVTGVAVELGKVSMRGAKGAEFDVTLDHLNKYHSLVLQPPTLLDAIGEIQCNAPGLTREATKLREMFEGHTLHAYSVERDMHGDVSVRGRIAENPKRSEG